MWSYGRKIIRGFSMQYHAFRIALVSALGLTAGPALAAKCPNLHIVLDSSGSMSGTIPGGTRWSVAKDAVNKVVEAYDGRMPIGLTIFPGGGCNSTTAVQPDYKTKAKIKMA